MGELWNRILAGMLLPIAMLVLSSVVPVPNPARVSNAQFATPPPRPMPVMPAPAPAVLPPSTMAAPPAPPPVLPPAIVPLRLPKEERQPATEGKAQQPVTEAATKKPASDKSVSTKPAPVPAEPPKLYKKAGDYCEHDTVPAHWVYPPGKRPCSVIERGGSGLSKGGKHDKVYCRYLCGDRQTKRLEFWGNSYRVCLEPRNRPVY